ncbi:MAG: FG-GAP-like repeat-containing protein [Deltaproteobacteria bacterium]|nr:FG-GAP-like repeat-containing protein [Myxococcales bacterium]MDP3218083.1 FG-GAP-like repeat-containing protein [Deltaproteobacteria bacterium]
MRSRRGACRVGVWCLGPVAWALTVGCEVERSAASDAGVPVADDRPEARGADSGAAPNACAEVIAAGVIAGGFTDLTAAVEATLPTVPPAPPFGSAVLSHATIGDVDADGAPDILYATQGDPTGSVGYRYDAASGTLARHEGPWLAAPARGIVDLDGDGRDDVVGTGEGPGSGVPPVLWGGAGAFVPLLETGAIGAGAMWLDDIDHDGWIDVLVGAELRSPCGAQPTVRAFLQTAPRRFEERPALVPARVRVGEGTLFMGPLGGRRVVGAVGNHGGCELDAPVFFAEGPVDGEAYPTFQPMPVVAGSIGGPMGAAIADLDQDGRFELAITGDPRFHLWRGGDQIPLALVPDAGGMGTLLGSLGVAQKPWAVAYLDLDRDGRQDTVVTHGNHNTLPTEAPIGPQWTSVHLHGDGDFCMGEVDGALGLDRGGDWRSLSVGDLDADGDPDLVVGGRGAPARVYRNDLRPGRNGFGLRLRGTTSNALGVGARVEVRATASARVQHHLVGAMAPPQVFTNPLLFVGVGEANAAEEVTIRWPSGTVQVLRDVAAGRTHLVVEPPSIVVEPPARRRPADGASTVRLRVTPRGPDGSPAVGAQVTFRLLAGDGSLGPAVVGEGETSVEVTAPAARGSCVVEVSVDGHPMATRPRIWWD